MLEDLKQHSSLGTPVFFLELLRTVCDSKNSKLSIDDVNQLFYNRLIDGNMIFNGCIEIAVRIKLLVLSDNIISVNTELLDSLKRLDLLTAKFIEFLFIALVNDDEFNRIFCSHHITYDVVQKAFLISNKAFRFKYANFKQLLLNFDVIKAHPIPRNKRYLLNPMNMCLFDRIILPEMEIRKRRMGVKEFEESMKQRQINGEEAEKYVLSYEMDRLNNAKKVEWVAKYIVNEGYDIASFNSESDIECNRFIEVKSYVGERPYFYWSRNEYQVAQIKQRSYWLYLVNREEMKKSDYVPRMINNPFKSILCDSDWDTQIENYRIDFKN